jgi:hypothetical protein
MIVTIAPSLSDVDVEVVEECLRGILGDMDVYEVDADVCTLEGQSSVDFYLVEDSHSPGDEEELARLVNGVTRDFLVLQDHGFPRSREMRSIVEKVGKLILLRK